MTITPNQLTWFRLIVAPTVPIIFTHDGNVYKLLACIIYVGAAFTDLIDGILARRRKQVTAMGKILDPIADKALVLGALIALVIDGILNAWWLLPIIFRELSVTLARLLLLLRKEVVAATQSGKIKVVVQHGAVFLFFLLSLRLSITKGILGIVLNGAAYAFLAAAVWFTLKSGYDFFAANGGQLFGRKTL